MPDTKNKNNNPLVCVCIPAYNSEKYIKRTIECVLSQTYTNIIIKVIDNASQDDTCNIVKKINDSRVQLIQNNKNIGMVGNFNRCLENSCGDYLQILCSDDIISNMCIEKKVAFLEKHKDCALAFSASQIKDGNENVIAKRKFAGQDRVIDGHKMLIKAFRRHNYFGEPSNVLIRTSAIKSVGSFDDRMYYAVDWEYWTRLCLAGNVGYVNEPLSYFYIRSTSETGTLLKKKNKILLDDKLFVEICKSNHKFNINKSDILMHNISRFIRLNAKIIILILSEHRR